MLLKQPTDEQQAQEKAKLAKPKKTEEQTFDYIGLDDKKERISLLFLLFILLLLFGFSFL